MTGYQQGILYLIGSLQGERYIVRNVNRHYIDCVADLFAPYSAYHQRRNDGKRDYWCIKSPHIQKPSLDDVTDCQGFVRSFVELQGNVDLWRHKNHRGDYLFTPRLRIYGAENDLLFVGSHIPAEKKKMQYVTTATGKTCMIVYQSPREIADICDHLYGTPRNDELWQQWFAIISHK